MLLITPSKAIELAESFNLVYIVKRLQDDKNTNYKTWQFSFKNSEYSEMPDLMPFILSRHISYAYGDKDNIKEKYIVDTKFLHDLIYEAKLNNSSAEDILQYENRFGRFKWGFARK